MVEPRPHPSNRSVPGKHVIYRSIGGLVQLVHGTPIRPDNPRERTAPVVRMAVRQFQQRGSIPFCHAAHQDFERRLPIVEHRLRLRLAGQALGAHPEVRDALRHNEQRPLGEDQLARLYCTRGKHAHAHTRRGAHFVR